MQGAQGLLFRLLFKKKHHLISILVLTIFMIPALLLLLLVFTLRVPLAGAYAGNYSTTSPFSCGSNCTGGYELFGNDGDFCTANPGVCFNTIDDCTDGSDTRYEFVDNITITNLNNPNFRGGDTINIDAYLDCDSDSDQVVFAYSNGSGFRSVYNTTCVFNGKTHKYYNFTLDNLAGNHTVRMIISYKGTYPGFGNITCGNQAPEARWADSDDVSFYVNLASDDESPQVSNPSPEAGTTYEKQEGLEVIICVDATDDYGVSSVTANITSPAGNSLLPLSGAGGDSFCDGYSDTSEIGTYNITFIVNDATGNTNDSVTTYFVIQKTTNITLHKPIEGDIIAYGPLPLNFTVGEGYEADAVFYSLDEGENTTISGGRVNVSFTQSDSQGALGEKTTDYANLSMSFVPAEDMNVSLVSISLKRNGSGTPDAQLQVRTDDSGQPSDTILGQGNITNSSVSETNYSFVSISLDTAANLTANTKYWLFLTPDSTAPDFYYWEASNDSLYANGNYSNNASLDLLFAVYDKYNFRTYLLDVEKGEHTIQVYANSSTAEPIASPQVSFTVDQTAPDISDIIYEPSDDASLDPNVPVNFTITATDDLAIQQVILQYKKEEDSEFQNTTANETAPDTYLGTVTPDSEGTWIFRAVAIDTSDNIAYSDQLLGENITLSIAYDYDWSITPESFDITSALLNTNISIGILAINNAGDINFTFNVSKEGSVIPNVYFNNTQDSLVVNVSHGSFANVNITITGQSIESEQTIIIQITALDDNAQPSDTSMEFTFISYVSGAYLKLDIIEYDATVTQGQTRVALTARITNAGNDAASDVIANWELPSGWEAKTNLTAEWSSLGVGQEETFTRYFNVLDNATTGLQDITVYVNCSEGKNDSDSRTVNVSSSEAEVEETITPSHSGGGGGGAPITPEKTAKLDVNIKNQVEIERGTNLTMTGILENAGEIDFKTLSLSLENFPMTHYKIRPAAFDELRINATKSFALFLNAPEYLGGGKQESTLRIKTLAGNAWKEFTKPITIIIVTEDKADALGCFENAAAKISELESQKIITTSLSTKLQDAKNKYADKNYVDAYNLCNEILKDAGLAAQLKGQLDSITGAYLGLGKDIPELGELIKLAQDAFEHEEYALASQRAEQAGLLIGIKEKELQQTLAYRVNFIMANWKKIIPLFMLAIVISIFVYSSTSLSAVKKRIRALDEREENIRNKMKEAQRKYFVEKLLPARAYDKEMEQYRRMLAEVENKKGELEIKRLKIISHRTIRDLEMIRSEIEEKKKVLQRKYFIEKTIDKKTFKRLIIGLDRSMQEIDKKIAMKK